MLVTSGLPRRVSLTRTRWCKMIARELSDDSTLTDRLAFASGQRISYTLKDASKATGLSVRQLECAILRGELKYRIVGRNRIIPAKALRKLVGEE
jgi:hypothetical protein